MKTRIILANRLRYVGDVEQISVMSARVGMMLLKLIAALKKRLKPE